MFAPVKIPYFLAQKVTTNFSSQIKMNLEVWMLSVVWLQVVFIFLRFGDEIFRTQPDKLQG
jgi:hypothetical protein